MSTEYNNYLNEHIANVNKALIWMADNLSISELGLNHNALSQAIDEAHHHDESKYSDREYGAYDAYFYGGNRSFKVVQEFNYAWLHHIHHNPHHWQYWVLFEDDPENGKPYRALEMPDCYILEMIADWWSFSWKVGNLKEIFDWYYGTDKKKGHNQTMVLADRTKMIVEKIIQKLRDILTEKKEEDKDSSNGEVIEHHGILGMKWGIRRFQNKDGSLTVLGKKRYSRPENADMDSLNLSVTHEKDWNNRIKEMESNGEDTSNAKQLLKERKAYLDKYTNKDRSEYKEGFDGELLDLIDMEIFEELGMVEYDDVKHSDIFKEDDEKKYGIPEIKKFPMPDADHVKSAIRFFNYVDPKYEKELAEAILDRMKEYGIVLGEDISVGDENRFKKYIPEEEKNNE